MRWIFFDHWPTILFLLSAFGSSTTLSAATATAGKYLRRPRDLLASPPEIGNGPSSESSFWSHFRQRFSSSALHFGWWPWRRKQPTPNCDYSRIATDCSGTMTTPAPAPFIDPTQNAIYGRPIPSDPSSQGHRTQNNKVARVVGGVEAVGTEAPFFVSLFTWNGWLRQWQSLGCAGTLISNRHVLTAAHCVADRNALSDAVYVNAYRPFEGNSGYPFLFARVANYTLHPNFNAQDHYSDVAVITLATSVNQTSFPAVDMADSSMTVWNGQMAKVYGFGRVAETNDSSVDTLRVAHLPFISHLACQAYYSSGLLLDDMICAGYARGSVDACYGDSGGPLLIRRRGGLYLVGTVSWGVGCGRPDKPGVYASVQYHHAWIQGIVCSDPLTDPSMELCSVSLVPSSAPSPTLGSGLPTWVEDAVDQNADAASISSSGPTSPPSTTTIVALVRDSAGCTLKEVGEQCMFGGECCSGVCAWSVISTTTSSSSSSQLGYVCTGTTGSTNAVTSTYQLGSSKGGN